MRFPAIKDLQVSIGSMKKERDEAKLRLSDKDRELTELRQEVIIINTMIND